MGVPSKRRITPRVVANGVGLVEPERTLNTDDSVHVAVAKLAVLVEGQGLAKLPEQIGCIVERNTSRSQPLDGTTSSFGVARARSVRHHAVAVFEQGDAGPHRE